jgi:hypothetical protein
VPGRALSERRLLRAGDFQFVGQTLGSLLRVSTINEVRDHRCKVRGIVRIGFEVVFVFGQVVFLVAIDMLD